MNANKEDFGEYECCALNAYGQICSNIFVQEIKSDSHKQRHPSQVTSNKIATSTSMSILARLTGNDFVILTTKRKLVNENDKPNIINDDSLLTTDEFQEDKNDTSIVSLDSDSKDKRRHYLIKTKQFLHLESQSANTAATSSLASYSGTAFKQTKLFFLIYSLFILFKNYLF